MKMGSMFPSLLMTRTSLAFVGRSGMRSRTQCLQYSVTTDVNLGVSRVETVQSLLASYGAPGSAGCNKKNDLEPVFRPTNKPEETPELISSVLTKDELANLHPHLFPLLRSKSTGNLVCALKSPLANEVAKASENAPTRPWPIVESTVGGPGMKLLSLNSEYLMRRIACEVDFSGENTSLIDMYNEGLGKGLVQDKAWDYLYEPGAVEELGYGVDKYVLLRVGPFTDIYESLALSHAEKGDESSALIAAEACSNKNDGFASTFLFYAKLLSSFPNREDEARDAARMCLRLPVPLVGLSFESFREVAIYGQIAVGSDSEDVVRANLQDMHDKTVEQELMEDPQSPTVKTPEQTALQEAGYLLDRVAISGGSWREVRPEISELYRSVGREDMADFVEASMV